MKLRSFAAFVAAVVLFACGTLATPASAQVGKAIIASNFGPGAEAQCFVLEGQRSLCWIHDGFDNIGFYHSNGVGPIAYWHLDAKFKDLGVSDDGKLAILVTEETVEVLTLELRQPSRLAGISTPRLRLRLVVEGALSASIAGDNLLVLFANRLEVHSLKMRVFLPMVQSDVCTPPECVHGEDPGEQPPTPERGGPVVPTRTPMGAPTENPCKGLSSDPPECAKRTPMYPTPEVGTAVP